MIFNKHLKCAVILAALSNQGPLHLSAEEVSDVIKDIESKQQDEAAKQKTRTEQLKEALLNSKSEENTVLDNLRNQLTNTEKKIKEDKKDQAQASAEYGTIIIEESKNLEDLIAEQKKEKQILEENAKEEIERLETELEESNRLIKIYKALSERIDAMNDEMFNNRISLSLKHKSQVEKREQLSKEVQAERLALQRMKSATKNAKLKSEQLLEKNKEIEKLNRKRLNERLTKMVQELPRFAKEAEAMIKENQKFEKVVQEKLSVLTNKYNLSIEQQADLTRLISAELGKLFGMVDANTQAIELDKKLGVYLERIGVIGSKNRNYMEQLSNIDSVVDQRTMKSAQQLGQLKQQVSEMARLAQADRLRQEQIMMAQQAEINRLKRRNDISSRGESWIAGEGFNLPSPKISKSEPPIYTIKKQAHEIERIKSSFDHQLNRDDFILDHNVGTHQPHQVPHQQSKKSSSEWQNVKW